MTQRRLPRWSEYAPFIHRSRTTQLMSPRLARAASIGDLRSVAKRRVPRAVFDYVDGGAEAEVSLARARKRFADLEFHPSVLRDVSQVDPGTTLLGRPAALPLVFAPTGLTRLMHHDGEQAVARAAAELGIPYALSTMGTTTPEAVADAAPTGHHWFQLYMARDRRLARDLVERAAGSGFVALVLTVDVATSGLRLRDVRNGFTVPPSLNLRNLAAMAGSPRWAFNMLTTGAPTVAAIPDRPFDEVIDGLIDPAVSVDDVGWLREIWPGPLVVKGIQSVTDARLAVELGADAIVLSNHGGRQLDRAPTPLDLLPETVATVGDTTEVYVDSGVLSGADIVAAVAMGARGVLVGRAYLYGLMAGGQQGVQRAGQILRDDVIRTMRLLGTTRLGELNPSLVSSHQRRPEPHDAVEVNS